MKSAPKREKRGRTASPARKVARRRSPAKAAAPSEVQPTSGGPAEHGIPPGSGWPVEPRDRGDFYHRARALPADVKEWRDGLVQRVRETPGLFRNVTAKTTLEETRELVDEGIAFIREVARLLELLYENPRLGNKADPVDELVYIILSRKTREGAYQRGFEALKARFARWEDLLEAPRDEVTSLVWDGGLAEKKTESLFGALGKLRDTFGACTLEPAREWPDEKLEDFLCELPEVSRKSAYCIMMYSMGRQVLPVDTHVGRVLSRIGPYRELGLDLTGLDHKQLQAVLADLMPPNLRYGLHVNLLVHGRAVCRSPRPLCEQCEVRNFCGYFRAESVAKAAASGAPTVIDLFSGAGGLSEGFQRAGFRIVAASDLEPVALKTYRLNHPAVPEENVIAGDVRELDAKRLRKMLGGKRLDVLAGAPPCQGFSMAGFRSKAEKTGYRLTSDARNFLFEHLVGLALELKPRLFLMENVPGMQSAKKDNLSFLEAAARLLETQGGYRTAVWRLNAAAFGVPQERMRYFLVATAGRHLPSPPAEEYQNTRRQDFDVDALPPVTLGEAIFDLPPVDAGNGNAVERWSRSTAADDPRLRRYLGKFSLVDRSALLYNHAARYQNERDLELYALLKPGEDSVAAIERYGRDDLMRYRRDVFDDKYARLRAERPSKTIVAHLAKDGNGYIHPTQTRGITPREAARIQSFPDGYAFCGSPSDQWVQIGNAVPPVLGEAIARSFIDALRRDE